MHEFSSSVGRTLEELRTIHYLEETVGPAGLRRLADSLPDDAQRDMLRELRHRAATASLELEAIIEDWSAAVETKPRKPKPPVTGGLDPAEIVESFVEVKRASSELLRRASRNAPTERLRQRLVALAEDEEEAARKLERLTT